MTTYQFPVEDVERAIEHFDAAVTAFAGQPGLERADFYVNRRTGAGIALTLWRSHDDMKASEDEADRLRGEIAVEVAGWIQSVEEYELVRSERP